MAQKVTLIITFFCMTMFDNLLELFPRDFTIFRFYKNPYNNKIYITGMSELV